MDPLTVDVDELAGLAGRDLGPSGWIPVTQVQVDAFADTVDDRHWIHNDVGAAARGPFGGPIGHAHLTLSLFPALFRRVLAFTDGSSAMFYGYNRVRFPAPVPVGGRLRMGGRVLGVDHVGGATQLTVACAIEVGGLDKPACVAEAIWRHYALAGGA